MRQSTLFAKVEGNVTVNNFATEPGESKTTPATVKLTHTEKKNIQDFCFKNDITVSDFMRRATNFFYEFYDQSDKLAEYKKAVMAMLEQLP